MGAEWFNTALPESFKRLIHPIDRTTPPTGPGWVVQLVGHHYNPNPSADELRLPPGKRVEFGPYQYMTQKILPGLINPNLRVQGVHHVTLAWMSVEPEWTMEKGVNTNGLASTAVPLLTRATPPVAATPGGSPGGETAPPMGGSMAVTPGMEGGMGGRMGMGGAVPGIMPGMGGMSPMMGMGGPQDPSLKKQLVTLTRTDFLIQFVWQPPTPDQVPKTPEELRAKITEIYKQMTDADKNKSQVVPPNESELVNESKKLSQEVTAPWRIRRCRPLAARFPRLPCPPLPRRRPSDPMMLTTLIRSRLRTEPIDP